MRQDAAVCGCMRRGAAGCPVAGSPVAGSPVAGSPAAGSPVAGSPVAAHANLVVEALVQADFEAAAAGSIEAYRIREWDPERPHHLDEQGCGGEEGGERSEDWEEEHLRVRLRVGDGQCGVGWKWGEVGPEVCQDGAGMVRCDGAG